jgi:hypothetical protein
MSSPTPHRAKPWNWHRPEQCQSWLLRSPGILSRRVPCGFLPLGRRLLDQPSQSAMRNPSRQLNDESLSKGHARSALANARAFQSQALASIARNYSVKRTEIAAQIVQCGIVTVRKMRSMLRNRPEHSLANAAFSASALPLLRQIAQIIIGDGPTQGQLLSATVPWHLNLPPQSSASWQ